METVHSAHNTFGGNPLASAVAIASLKVIKDERLVERSAKLGEELRDQLVKIQERIPQYIKNVRGRGLFNAVVLKGKAFSPLSAYDICLKLKERGVLTKPTHGSIIRLTPPFSIRKDSELDAYPLKALHDVLEIDVLQLMKEKPQSDSSNILCDRCGRNLTSIVVNILERTKWVIPGYKNCKERRVKRSLILETKS